MKRFFLLCLLLSAGSASSAQELYVSSEPASNMPANSAGIRLTVETMAGGRHRDAIESMIGLNKRLMFHASAYRSNVRDKSDLLFEGWSVYGKYRFLSVDSVQRHFRMALYARLSRSKAPLFFNEVNLEGDNSGWAGGVIATQLLHKLALSSTVGYLQASDNGAAHPLPPRSGKQLSYSASAGYLVLPREYTSYKQLNVNVYTELLGKSDLQSGRRYLEVAPALQFIVGSRLRADVSKRAQLYGTMLRSTRNMLLFRLEYSFFNLY